MKVFQKAVWAVLAILSAILIFMISTFEVEDMTLVKGKTYAFNDNWTLLGEDGTTETISSLPYAGDCAAYETVVIKNTIPEKYWGMTLSFLSADKMLKVYMDGKVVYEFGTKDKKAFGHTPGSITNFIDIPSDLTKGEIVIEMVSPYENYAANISAMTIAKRDIAILQLMRSNLFKYACNIIILFAGGILMVLASIQKVSGQSTYGMEYLCTYCSISSIYYWIETKTLHIFYGNQTLYSVLVFFIMMIMPVLLLPYYGKSILSDFKKRFEILLILSYANIFIQLTLQLLNIKDFMEMAYFSHGLIFLTIIVVLKSFYDASKNGQHFIIEFIALFSMGAGNIIDLCRSYIIKIGDFGKYSRYGMVIFCIAMVIAQFVKVTKSYSAQIAENARLLKREVKNVERQNKQLLQAKEEAENAKMEALRANAAKSNFLASMSHEIRTPINAVLGMDSMIIRESKDTAITEYARDIQIAGKSLLSLINDILDFSKMESGKMEILPVEYELSSLLNDCYSMIIMRAREKNLEVVIENDKDIPRRLFGDELRIRQIIMNLLTNAVKYTKEGTITLTVRGELQKEADMLLKIAVKDTGMGIAKEEQSKLFQSFQRVDEDKNRNIEGTGLGLTIAKQLVELMKGSISFESEYGKGSVFKVEIPQKIRSHEPLGDFSANYMANDNTTPVHLSYQECFHAPKGRILVVDDVPMNLKVMKGLLKYTKLQIDTADRGERCLEMVKEKKYHIIFLDHMMPEMDGIETLRRMQQMEKSLNKDTPIVMLTANAIMGAKEEYLDEGFSDYLSKPVREKNLEEMILKYLPKELVEEPEQEETVKEEPEQDGHSFIEKVSFLDVSKGLMYCAGNEAFYKEMLISYLDTKRDVMLQEYFSKEDWDNYRIQVHALKSTSLSIGAVNLSDTAKELEMAVKKKDFVYVREQHEQMLQDYRDIIAKLQSVLE